MRRTINRLPCTVTNILWAAIKCTKDPVIRTQLVQAIYLKRQPAASLLKSHQYPYLTEKELLHRSSLYWVMRGHYIQLQSMGVEVGSTNKRVNVGRGSVIYKPYVRVYGYTEHVTPVRIGWPQLKKYLYPLRVERRWLTNDEAKAFAKRRYNLDIEVGSWADKVNFELAGYTDNESPDNVLSLDTDFVFSHYNFRTLL